ncbi:MAG: DUF4920 domain-containing protein [Candidatus Kapabacteria bacterium]|nr:DUF4920 domain-containing protein [Candidatus Kapabacteria bacterium]
MFRLLLLSMSIVVAVGIGRAQSTPQGSTYGDAPSSGESVTLAKAVDTKTFNAPCRITATVSEVCQKKGCWMILKDKDLSVRVTFKDYGFFVPKDLAGRRVLVEGVLSQTVLSEADARHYAEDGGASKEEIAKIKGDQRELGFEATGVKVLK